MEQTNKEFKNTINKYKKRVENNNKIIDFNKQKIKINRGIIRYLQSKNKQINTPTEYVDHLIEMFKKQIKKLLNEKIELIEDNKKHIQAIAKLQS